MQSYQQIPSVPPGALVDDDLADILSRDIPWETYMTARLITDKDLQLIRRYDKRSADLQNSLLEENGAAYVAALVSVLRNVTKEETVQYVLALLCQMLDAAPARAKLFRQTGTEGHAGAEVYSVFLRLLQRQDWFTQEKAARLFAAILTTRPDKGAAFSNGVVAGEASSSTAPTSGAAPDAAEQAISSFIDWLCAQLRRPANPARSVLAAAAALSVLLCEKGSRVLFTRAGGVQLLAPLLRTAQAPSSSQLAYHLLMCLWQLAFYRPAVEVMATTGMIKGMVDIVRSAQKEKVVRVGLLGLRKLIETPGLDLGSDAVEAGLPKVVASRMLQRWGDEDIGEALTALDESLAANIVVLSSWDKYKKEVLSGTLDWSPMHTSELFWRSNVDKFEEKDFQILRVLIKLIEQSRDYRTVAVGCSDLGRFIDAHAHGRFIVSDLRGKELVMRLLASPNEEVRKQALLTMQRLMLPRDKLDFLQSANATTTVSG